MRKYCLVSYLEMIFLQQSCQIHKIMLPFGITEKEVVCNSLVATHRLQFYEIQLFIYYYLLHTYYLLSLFKLILLLAYQIPHLLELGINAVELLPVFEFDELEFQRRPNPRDHMVNQKSIMLCFLCQGFLLKLFLMYCVFPNK